MCVRVTENIQISRGETVESEDAERRTSNWLLDVKQNYHKDGYIPLSEHECVNENEMRKAIQKEKSRKLKKKM
jgi:hypothetical protein